MAVMGAFSFFAKMRFFVAAILIKLKNGGIPMKIKRLVALLLGVLLAVSFVACAKEQTPDTTTTTAPDGIILEETPDFYTVTVDITDNLGTVSTFVIQTNAETLRGALEQENLIEGEEGPYGIYVKKVNGVTADYDVDQSYWAFYKNGETLNTGIDGEKISDGAHYEIVYTK